MNRLNNVIRHFSSHHNYQYDLIIIGGGSGGLACSREAIKINNNLNIAVLDYVDKSPYGNKWGLGGTCVNVGCIPKKLFHHASLLHKYIKDSTHFGWKNINISNIKHDWNYLVNEVNNYIKSLNFGYRVALKNENIQYFNAKGRFIDKNCIELINNNGNIEQITANNIILAMGGRPIYPNIDGKQYIISSDDIFTLKNSPGKTLVIGASYVALECAGFLNGLGYNTTICVRSKILRHFDQDMAKLIEKHMINEGIEFIYNCTPVKIKKLDNNKFEVTFDNGKLLQYDTILSAIGRKPSIENLNLEKIGIKINQNGIITDDHDKTNISNIYAIGDVALDRPQLTPVAIQAGIKLAHRLYNNSTKLMNYNNIPTTVFTPLEYSCIGLTESKAFEIYGNNNIEVYHAHFQPLEWTISHHPENICYTKIICRKSDNFVLGIHFLGPSAGEVMQGFALAFNSGIHYEDILNCVGIHPTCAEEIIRVNITKSSGISPQRTGC